MKALNGIKIVFGVAKVVLFVLALPILILLKAAK